MAASWVVPASAQFGASLSLLTDDRFRGQSLSDHRPVATLDLSYDDAGGFYGGASATGVATAHEGAQLLSVTEYAGFTHPLGQGPAIEIGAIHCAYTEYSSRGSSAHYTEVYLGLVGAHVAAHIRYAPDYFRSGVETVLGDVDGVLTIKDWRLNAHVGLLRQVSGWRMPGADPWHPEWRLAIARPIRRFTVQLALTGGGAAYDIYEDNHHRRVALVAGTTYVF